MAGISSRRLHFYSRRCCGDSKTLLRTRGYKVSERECVRGCQLSALSYSEDLGEFTHILERVEHGDPKAAAELLPIVYEELRRLAAQKMANEAAGHTLQPTALVHEAWLRLGGTDAPTFQNRAHFFGAAAALSIAVPTAKQWWAYARAWLTVEMRRAAPR